LESKTNTRFHAIESNDKDPRMSTSFAHVTVPADGEPIRMTDSGLQVPDQPIVPFIEGDGTGPDIWRRRSGCSMPRWKRPMAASGGSPGWRCLPGRRRSTKFENWLPDDTLDAFREFLVGIKGPLTTPVGGGIRSLNVALRQISICTPACARCATSPACPPGEAS
jgi:isocitrate dehydrogenase